MIDAIIFIFVGIPILLAILRMIVYVYTRIFYLYSWPFRKSLSLFSEEANREHPENT